MSIYVAGPSEFARATHLWLNRSDIVHIFLRCQNQRVVNAAREIPDVNDKFSTETGVKVCRTHHPDAFQRKVINRSHHQYPMPIIIVVSLTYILEDAGIEMNWDACKQAFPLLASCTPRSDPSWLRSGRSPMFGIV